MKVPPLPLLSQIETSDGNINVIIDGRQAALFPKECAEQVTFLIDSVNRRDDKRKGKPRQ